MPSDFLDSCSVCSKKGLYDNPIMWFTVCSIQSKPTATDCYCKNKSWSTYELYELHR